MKLKRKESVLKVTSKYFECDTCVVLLSEIGAIILADVGKPDKHFVICTKGGITFEIPLGVKLLFNGNVQMFKKYLGI